MPRGICAFVAASLFVISTGSDARAQSPEECQAELDSIDRLLEDQARRARWWNIGWGAGFGTAAVAQGVFAAKPDWAPIIDVDADMQKGLWVSTGKASLGSLSRIILPLRIPQVEPLPDEGACDTLTRAERALREAARKQRNTFWLNHVGSLAVNVGGALILGLGYDIWDTAFLSVAIGYPVGLVSTYTMPRGAWRAERRKERWMPEIVSVAPVVAPRFRGLAISGFF